MTSIAFETFIKTASGNKSSLLSPPNRIAVFGGPLSPSADPGISSSPKSQRDAFVRWAKANRPPLAGQLLLPENYDDWNDFSTYSDLLRFEEDLGYMTCVVVIFLEAPGSIAELGAFSQIDNLNKQLVLVVRDQYHPKKSFISLGPLRQLETEDRYSICTVPDRPLEQFDEDIDIILDAIEKKCLSARNSRTLDIQNAKHQIILALDAVTLFEVATFSEIKSVLSHFGVQLPDVRVRQILFTLLKTAYIGSRRYGGIDYYYPVERGKSWIDYAGTAASGPFNRLRLSAKIANSRTGLTPADKVHTLVFGGSKI